ncbi:MAG: hypothetical protein U9R21_06205 [Candidatus Thermoplasmatota archaeon]|nr:hypothetical protein [Candidatus Thermoplasmatota archaeon]
MLTRRVREMKKKELDRLMEIKGEVKGVVFQTDAKYVLEKEGEEGLKKLEERVKELGYPINYEKGEALDSHPIGLRVISLLLIKDTFGWPDSEIKRMGYVAPRTSFIAKLLMRFFVSFKKIITEAPRYWTKHYTIGSLEVINLDEETKDVTIRLKDFEIHPILCPYYRGYFEMMHEFATGTTGVESKETKCMFKGDPYHEYVFKGKRE